MRKFLKNQEGFTLVELMVVVAIIGVLSAVAVPQFKVYQAKAKQSEAKVSLAAVYTAEVSSQSDYDTFATCLDFLGYEKPNQGYYRVGFNADFGNAQVQSKTGGGATSCPTGGTYVDPTTVLKEDQVLHLLRTRQLLKSLSLQLLQVVLLRDQNLMNGE